MHKILIVDDEPALRDLVELILKREKYEVATAIDGKSAISLTERFRPDLLLLDIMLPDMSGYEVYKKAGIPNNIPTIMLTAKNEVVDKVIGLELGADDYITKPFDTMELIARVKAVLRRVSGNKKAETILHNDLQIDFDNMIVRKNDQEIVLTLKEFQLLELLARNPKKVFTRDDLLQKVWGFDYMGDSRVVDICIARLRKKIETDCSEPVHVTTIFGIGYRFGGNK